MFSDLVGSTALFDPKLWPHAEREQEQRLTHDPWVDMLESALDGMNGKITNVSVWEILDVPGGHRTQEQSRRLGEAMRNDDQPGNRPSHKIAWARILVP
jgi:hypothetical protein